MLINDFVEKLLPHFDSIGGEGLGGPFGVGASIVAWIWFVISL